MSWHVEDGSPVPPDEQRNNIDMLLREWQPAPQPNVQPGLRLPITDDIARVICCAGPYFTLERWRVAGGVPLRSPLSTQPSSATSDCP